jgi:hypothetical protein
MINLTNILRAQIPKAQKDTETVTDIFTLLRSLRLKFSREDVGEIDPK